MIWSLLIGVPKSTTITINPFFTHPGFSGKKYEYKVEWSGGTVIPFTKVDRKKDEFNLSHPYMTSNSYAIEVVLE